MLLPTKVLLALLPFFLRAKAQSTGTTTRYWDCCKPSCAWPGKAALLSGSSPVLTCDVNNNPLTDPNAVSGCNGGTSYQCSNESPWAVNDNLAYGYAAVNIAGGSEISWCCACYELTFTSGPIAGKKMVVQATNTGGDLDGNQFDISIPGGGVGIFNGCTTEWGAPSSGWGVQYGGVTAAFDCASLPEALQAGCDWRFGWFEGADNPTVSFEQVACPAALTANTGCVRADDSSFPAVAAVSGSAVAAVSSTTSTDPTLTTTQAIADPTTNDQVVADPTTSSQAVVDPTTSIAAAVVVPTLSSIPVEQVSTSLVAALVSTPSSGITTATTTSADPISSTDPVVTTTIYRDDVCEL